MPSPPTAVCGPQAVKIDLGVDVLPKFAKDNTDRNRTSPFAFTGNKFEFRMPGSSSNISDANTVLNTAVAKEPWLCRRAGAAQDFDSAVIALVKRTIRDHKRVIFNGNGYTKEWEAEAAADCQRARRVGRAGRHDRPQNLELFAKMGVLSETEARSRYEVKLEHYAKLRHIEAVTMMEITRRQLVPATLALHDRPGKRHCRKAGGLPGHLLQGRGKGPAPAHQLHRRHERRRRPFEAQVEAAEAVPTVQAQGRARAYHDQVLPAMNALRAGGRRGRGHLRAGVLAPAQLQLHALLCITPCGRPDWARLFL